MKLRLSLFLIGLFIAAIGIGTWVDATTKIPDPRHRLNQRYISTGAGVGAGLATFGIGVAIGIPIILRQRKQNQ